MNLLPYLLITIVILSALLFGSVESWSLAVIGILTGITFVLFAFRFRGFNGDRPGKNIAIAAVALFAYGLFQLIPLPVSLLQDIHPGISQLIPVPTDPAATDCGGGCSSSSLIAHGSLLVAQPSPFHSISIYPFATEMDLTKMTIYLMLFSVTAFGIARKEEAYLILKALAIFGFILAMFAIMQKALGNGKIYWFREVPRWVTPYGPFVNKNHFAGWMGMVIPLSLGVGLHSMTLHRRIRYTFLSIVMAIALFYSFSRGGVVSFLFGMLLFGVIVFRDTLSRKRLIPLFLAMTALAFCLAYLGISPIVERFTQLGETSEQRAAVWLATLKGLSDFPVFGSGLGTFQHVFGMYRPDSVRLFYDHAHNDYVELLIEAGAIGTIMAAFFIFFAVRLPLRSQWLRRRVYIKAAIFASLLAIGAHSAFDFNLHIPSNAILLAVVLGLGVALARKSVEDQKAKRTPNLSGLL